ncbi:hypothetical protein PISMIDRAFT_20188 [Pisolithus microcarpus 441]|uniref:Uncharacterized protein n=1 Tax=Pisolithus microcarpus 441 TaxID=765257 RepID=A0A0C9YJX6_9AGAM|nr:hypothetical protein PISMIDRAFT_20188 [Pisolithus microcarpus 441]
MKYDVVGLIVNVGSILVHQGQSPVPPLNSSDQSSFNVKSNVGLRIKTQKRQECIVTIGRYASSNEGAERIRAIHVSYQANYPSVAY